MLTRQQIKIIDAGEAIRTAPEPDETEKAFMARQLVQVTLPHANPGNVPVWKRSNGNLTLSIRPGWNHGQDRSLGYPYGTIPRLLLFWITTEALRTENSRLELGQSLAAFMRELGLDPGRGGPRSDARRLRDQMERLFRATISFEQSVTQGDRSGLRWLDMQVAPEGMLWWDYRQPDQQALFGSWIELSPKFFEAITAAPVPVDLRALRALKRSPLALDLYAWASYTAFVATRSGKARFVSWRMLMKQLGTDYTHANNFRSKALAALRKIRAVYPGLIVGPAEGGIEILPGASAVPPRPAKRRLRPPAKD